MQMYIYTNTYQSLQYTHLQKNQRQSYMAVLKPIFFTSPVRQPKRFRLCSTAEHDRSIAITL
jgi:hypothetical protein